TKMTSKVPSIRKAICSECGGERNCDIRGVFEHGDSDEHFQWHRSWYILQCRGCEYVFIQTVSTNSEDIGYSYDYDGSTIAVANETLAYWPGVSKRERPEWLTINGVDAVDDAALNEALIELYSAL